VAESTLGESISDENAPREDLDSGTFKAVIAMRFLRQSAGLASICGDKLLSPYVVDLEARDELFPFGGAGEKATVAVKP
jgi:hypothetical protein